MYSYIVSQKPLVSIARNSLIFVRPQGMGGYVPLSHANIGGGIF